MVVVWWFGDVNVNVNKRQAMTIAVDGYYIVYILQIVLTVVVYMSTSYYLVFSTTTITAGQ